MNVSRSRFWSWVAGGALVAGITLALNVAVSDVRMEADLTQDQRFTLPPAVGRICSNLSDTCRITVYLSDPMPSYLRHLSRSVSTRLKEMNRFADGKIEWEFVDPGQDQELLKKLADLKLQPLSLQDVRGGEAVAGVYWMTMVFRHGKEIATLPLTDLGQDILKEERTLASLPGFIAARLLRVTQPDISVGIVSDKKLPPQNPMNPQQQQEAMDGLKGLRDRLATHCRVKDVTLKNGVPVPDDVKALVLFRPENLADVDLYQVDQYLMRGGRVIVLHDSRSMLDFDREQAIGMGLQQGNFAPRAVTSGMDAWLTHYGMKPDAGVLLDKACFQSQRLGRQQVTGPGGVPMFVMTPVTSDMPALMNVIESDKDGKATGQVDATELCLTGIAQLGFLAPSPFTVESASFSATHKGGNLTTLVSSSPNAWVSDAKDTLPFSVTPPTEGLARRPLVMRASGRLRSFFAEKDVPIAGETVPDAPKPPRGLEESQPGNDPQLWVVADADFAFDVWPQVLGQRLGAIGGARALVNTSVMLLNMVDASILGPEMVEIRRPRLADRSVDEARVKEDRESILFNNIALMPLALVAFGIVVFIWRKAQTFVPSHRAAAVSTAPVASEGESGGAST
jgi:ABC-2 type transport system permease protein